MKKLAAAVWLLAAMCTLFVGCAAQPPVSEAKAVVLSEVRDAVLQELNAESPFLLETEALMNLYGIEAQWVAASSGFVTMDGTFPDEVIFVQAADAASAEQIRGKLQSRLDEVLVQSKTYDAENYAAAQACTVRADGLYVCLILSPEQEMIAEIYQSFFD